jgi:hypothetical protein
MNGNTFDLVRLSHSKREADVSPNTIREYARQGLNLYRKGKAVFFSLAELEAFIKGRPSPLEARKINQVANRNYKNQEAA